MPLYLSEDRLRAADQAAAEAQTSELTDDITRRYAEAQAPEPPAYQLPSLSDLGVTGAPSAVMGAIGALPSIGRRAAAAAEAFTPTWALPSLESLGVSPAPPKVDLGRQDAGTLALNPPEAIPAPDQTASGTPVRSAAEMGAPTQQGTRVPSAGGSYADVTPDEDVTRESVTRSAAAALTKAGLPAGMAPYLAGIAINEGILQPGTIARDYWSVGGVKAPGSAGSVTVPTREVIDGQSVMQQASFGRFGSMQEGMDALARFVKESPNFGPITQAAAQSGDFSGLIQGFKDKGYATDPNWVTQVNSIAAGLPVPQAASAPAQTSQPAGQTVRVVPDATPNSYWTSEGTHGGAPAADIFAPKGSPIYAPVGGVSMPAVYPSGGNATIIKGDDGRYYYMAHGNVPFTGGRVEAGQAIGQVGDTGNAQGTPPHLHYSIATDPSVFDAKNGSGDITGEAYWSSPPNAGAASSPPAAPAAPQGGPVAQQQQPTPVAAAIGSTAQIGQAETGAPLSLKTAEPMPENPADPPQEGYTNPDLTPMPAPPVVVAPLPEDAMYRQPLDASTPVRDSWASEQPFDPVGAADGRDLDQGPREATPGSVGAQPAVYDPRVQDEAPGARELPVQQVAVPQAPVGGQDDPGTQTVNPVSGPTLPEGRSVGSSWAEPAPPEPYYPASPITRQGAAARADQEAARAAEPQAAPSLTQDVVPEVVRSQPAAIQKGVDAAVRAYNDPVWASVPAPARAVKIIQDVGNAYGDEVGRAVGRALGLSDEDTMSLLGIPFSQQDVAGTIGSIVTDPTNYVGASLADPVVTVAKGAVRDFVPDVVQGVVRRAAPAIARAGEVLSEGRATARALNEAPSSGMMLPGTLGISPDENMMRGLTRPRVVPPEVADTLDFPIRVPDDPAVVRAIEAVGGTVDPEKGVTLNVTRAQGASAAGAPATRGGVFYEAVPEGGRSSYVTSSDNPNAVGGTQVIPPQRTRFRSPLILSDAPGEMRGFNAAMEQLDVRNRGTAEEIARAEENLASRRAYVERYPQPPGSDYVAVAERELAELRDGTPLVAADIDSGIRIAKRAGPAGSPARAQALKDLVSRYGGDPNLIDDLLAIRGADASESAWAIKENILAGNARRQGYDGVVTVQPKPVDEYAVSNHPKVVAAAQASEQASAALDAAARAHDAAYEAAIPARFKRPPNEGFNEFHARVINGNPEYDAALERAQQHPSVLAAEREVNRAAEASEQAEQAYIKALDDVRAELGGHHITELMDPREARNPTPGEPNPRIASLETEMEDALRRRRAENGIDEGAWARALADYQNAELELKRLRRQEPYVGEPGYTLREDVPRRPSESPGATSTLGANASAGALPRTPGSDMPLSTALGSIGRAANTEALNAAGGGVAGMAVSGDLMPSENDTRTPEQRARDAALHFGVGALGAVGLRHGGRVLRRGAVAADEGGGALATLGVTPNQGPRQFANAADALQAAQQAMGRPNPQGPTAGLSRMEALRRTIVRYATDNRVDLAELQKEAQRLLGRPLEADEMVTELSRANPSGAAKVMIDDVIRPAVQAVGDQRENLSTLMRLLNNGDVAAATGNPNRLFSGGLTGADSQAAAAHLWSQLTPEQQKLIDQSSDALYRMVDHYRDEMVRAGVWTPQLAADLKQQYPHWVPTKILEYMNDPATATTGTKGISLRDRGLRKYTIDGTAKEAEDPIASLVRYVQEAESIIQKNETFNAFVNLRDQVPGWDQLIREVPSNATPARARGEKAVTGFVNGERKTYLVPAPMAAAIQMEQGQQVPVLRQLTQLFKEFITRTPMFVAGQIPLDAFAYTVREAAREGGPQATPRVLAELGKGYAEAFRGLLDGSFQGDAARYLREGGGMAGFYERSADAASKTLDDLTRRNMFEVKNAADARKLAGWLLGGGWVQAAGARVELAPRVASFRLGERRALQAGASAEKAALEGMVGARDVTLDFQRGGTAAKIANQIIPFFNVGVQSATTLPRVLRENPKGAAATLLSLVAAPTMAAEAWNRLDEQRSKDYDDVPDYVKDRGIVIMLTGVEGRDERGERRPNYALIPMRELAPVAILSRDLMQRAMGTSQRGVAETAQAILGAASPVQASGAADLFSSTLPPVASTGLQLAADEDFFRGGPIATTRRDEQASALATGIASATGYRPSQTDFAIRDTFGGAGAMASAASDLATGKRKDEDRIQNAPVVGGLLSRFVGDAVGGNLVRAQEAMRTPEVRKVLRDAGLRDDQLSPLDMKGPNDFPFTRQEQAKAQALMNQYLTDRNGVASLPGVVPNWSALPQAAKQNVVRNTAAAARARAEAEVMNGIPEADRQRRFAAASKQKAR